MKSISNLDIKKILVSNLNYIDEFCRKNNIHYSLIGGSLIGAIRHNGIIPWDDDIDIIIMPSDYNKFVDLFSSLGGNYSLLNPNNNNDYYYPFLKIVDNRTTLSENKTISVDEYGVYVDVFQYHFVSNVYLFRLFHYFKLSVLKNLLGASMLNKEYLKSEKNVLKRIRNHIACFVGKNSLKKMYLNTCNYSKETKYILSNWPAYGFKKEIQKAEWMKNFKYVKFENIEAMICSNYDDILKTTFGDYMQLPPEEKRVSNHSFNVYWKDGYETND